MIEDFPSSNLAVCMGKIHTMRKQEWSDETFGLEVVLKVKEWTVRDGKVVQGYTFILCSMPSAQQFPKTFWYKVQPGAVIQVTGRIHVYRYPVKGCPKGSHYGSEIVVDKYLLIQKAPENQPATLSEGYKRDNQHIIKKEFKTPKESNA